MAELIYKRFMKIVWLLIFGLVAALIDPDVDVLEGMLSSKIVYGTKLIIIPLNALGLANRLRTISAAFTIGEWSDRELFVLWEVNRDCPISFEEIVEFHYHSNLHVLSLRETSRFNELVRGSVTKLANLMNGSVYEYYSTSFLLKLAGEVDSDIVVVWSRGYHTTATSCSTFSFMKSLFYRGLVLAPAVRNVVDKVLFGEFKRFRSVIVGVHARAFDTDYDWPVATPLLTAGNGETVPSLRFDEVAGFEEFVAFMQHLESAFSGNVAFLICSNSMQLKKALIDRFPGRATGVVLDDPHGAAAGAQRSSSLQMTMAAAEFFLLGETAFIVHTRGSSFAREASYLHMRPVIDLSRALMAEPQPQEGSAVDRRRFFAFYSQHSLLPYCAMPEYIRSRSTEEISSELESRRVCYAQVAVGDAYRNICTLTYWVCPCACASSAEGYIEGVYCTMTVDQLPPSREGCVELMAESNGYSI